MAGPTERNPQGIFISYRRSDSTSWTGRLTDDLREYFGQDNVYRDVDSNRAAQNYLMQVRESIGAARVAMAVIGPDWLAGTEPSARPRLHDPNDPVRHELETILTAGIALIPVLVGGASMPPATRLPESLSALSTIHASRMSDSDWQYDLGRLLEALERHGLFATFSQPEATQVDWQPTSSKRYERVVLASRRRALDATVGAVEALAYKDRKVFAEAAQVTFSAALRTVVAKVVDEGPGRSRIILEYPAVKASLVASGAGLLAAMKGGVGLLAWPALRAWERRFAVGFLNNVQGVLEGRGVGEDSAIPRGVSDWRNRNREV
jgi:hypothetical protein